MSFLDRVRAAFAAPAIAAGTLRLSPYDDQNHLAHIIAPDWFPERAAMTRERAMSVPAVKRARTIICTTIAGIPLEAYDGRDVLAGTDRPAWLDGTAGPVSPYHRMLWTVDDLLFYGWSLWAVERDDRGHITAADRVPWSSWSFRDDAIVWVSPNGTETLVNPSSVVLIPGSDEGLLCASSLAVKHAADLLHAASTAAATPAAYLDLHQTNDYVMTDAERDRLIAGWRAARAGDNGGVAFSSNGIEVRELGTFSEHLLVEGRNAAALDIARATSLPGSMLDATQDKSSLTYETSRDKRRDLIDYGLSAYMRPIAARLGMNDVVPQGISIRFALGDDETEGTPDDGGSSTPPAPTENGVSRDG